MIASYNKMVLSCLVLFGIKTDPHEHISTITVVLPEHCSSSCYEI